MSRNNGKRYNFRRKRQILDYLNNHTYKETSLYFNISEPTLSRWKKQMESESKNMNSKLVLSIPKFWLDYLNEQINNDLWIDYNDAIISTIRYYFNNNKPAKSINSSDFTKSLPEIITYLWNDQSDFEGFVVAHPNKVHFKIGKLFSDEIILDIVNSWRVLKNRKLVGQGLLKLEFDNEKYTAIELSGKHIIYKKQGYQSYFLLGLRRRFNIDDDVFVIGKTFVNRKINIRFAMDTIKKIIMGLKPLDFSNEFKKSLNNIKESKPMSLSEFDQHISWILKKISNFNQKFDTIIIADSKKIYSRIGSWGSERKINNIIQTWSSLTKRRMAHERDLEIEFEDDKFSLDNLSGSYIIYRKNNPDGFLLLCLKLRFKNEGNRFIIVKTRENMDLNGWFNLNQISSFIKNTLKFKNLGDTKWKENPEFKNAYSHYKDRFKIPLNPKDQNLLESLDNKVGKKIKRTTKMLDAEDFQSNIEKINWNYSSFDGNITGLMLRELRINAIPEEVYQFTQLTALNLKGNMIDKIPKKLRYLKDLTVLNLSNNNLTEIPMVLLDLPNLERLDLSHNKISSIPKEIDIDFLNRIEVLDLCGNNLSKEDIPNFFKEFEMKNKVFVYNDKKNE